jgi:dTDP-4-amino-4,6-dideoxygalactose transaminase
MYRTMPSADPANLPAASQIASQVLCLPIFPDLSAEQMERIVGVILRA